MNKNPNFLGGNPKQIYPDLKTPEDCLAFAQKTNPKKEPLTIAKLRTYPGCGQYSEEEAANIILSLEQLALIIYDCMVFKSTICIDNQLVVSSSGERNEGIIPLPFNNSKTVAA